MRRLFILFAVLAMLAGIAAAADAPQAARLIPSLSELGPAVLRYFQARRDYWSGDLIARDQIEPAFPPTPGEANSVPLLGTSSAKRNPLPGHCLFQAVAHFGENVA